MFKTDRSSNPSVLNAGTVVPGERNERRTKPAVVAGIRIQRSSSGRGAADGRGYATGTLVAKLVEQVRLRMRERVTGSERVPVEFFAQKSDESKKRIGIRIYRRWCLEVDAFSRKGEKSVLTSGIGNFLRRMISGTRVGINANGTGFLLRPSLVRLHRAVERASPPNQEGQHGYEIFHN